MNTARDFLNVFRLYRRHRNGVKHSAVAAYRIAIQKLPF